MLISKKNFFETSKCVDAGVATVHPNIFLFDKSSSSLKFGNRYFLQNFSGL